MDVPKSIIFNGVKYNLVGQGRYYLSTATTNAARKNPKGLHVAVWEFYNGREVPEGCVIHHKDYNTLNNDISNLECLSVAEHNEVHRQRRSKFGSSEKQLKHLEKIRELTKEWHASEEGKEWHRKHSKEEMDKKRHIEICTECGQEFETCGTGTICRKCQNKLFQRKLRNQRYGTVFGQIFKRVCPVCGTEFETTVARKKYCCKKCATTSV